MALVLLTFSISFGNLRFICKFMCFQKKLASIAKKKTPLKEYIFPTDYLGQYGQSLLKRVAHVVT